RRQLELDGLERGEALAAGLALAPAADGGAIVADARIDDPGVHVLAEGAMHAAARLLGVWRGSAVDRQSPALGGDLLAHARDHGFVARVVEHVADPAGELDA